MKLQQEKQTSTKAVVRSKPIYETPMSDDIKLPQINGMTFNTDEVEAARRAEHEQLKVDDEEDYELIRYRFECNTQN